MSTTASSRSLLRMCIESLTDTRATTRFLVPLAMLSLAPTPFAQAPLVATRALTVTAEQAEILGHMSMILLDDGQGGTVKTLRISGINVQVVDGSGTTDGMPTGVGNLIVGYNELRGGGDDRTGSHNFVGGKEHNYTRFGGLVIGQSNAITGDWASVGGGRSNIASGYSSSVSGGIANEASGDYSSISGGRFNEASNFASSVSGGQLNVASGYYSSVSGGDRNSASTVSSSVSGGRLNAANGYYSSVSGGRGNVASGRYASVTGGENSLASGNSASVSGGSFRVALGNHDWAGGSLFEDQ